MAKQKKQNKGAHLNKLEARHREKERLTNWYMINLCWGLLGIIVLAILNYCYRTTSILVHMQLVSWIMTGVFAAGAIVVFLLGFKGVIKNRLRANHYAIFLGVCALVGLWLALYNKIRPVMENVLHFVTRNESLIVNSYWNVYIPMIGIAAYLVIAFIWYLVKEIRA